MTSLTWNPEIRFHHRRDCAITAVPSLRMNSRCNAHATRDTNGCTGKTASVYDSQRIARSTWTLKNWSCAAAAIRRRGNHAVGCGPDVTATISVLGDRHEEEDISLRDERIVACNDQLGRRQRKG